MAGPELTSNTAGAPYVEVFFNPADLPAGAASLRVYRFSDNRTWLVRGGVDIAVGVAVLDFECPFRVPATYRAEVFNDAGLSLGYTEVSTTVLNVSGVWVHNPLDPNTAVGLGPIALLRVTAAKNTRPTVGEVVYTEGSSVGQWVGTRRRGVTDMPFGLAVTSVQDADMIQDMLGHYETDRVSILCIRTPPPVRIPRTFFAAVTDLDERSRDVQWGGQRTDLLFSATEVAPPFPGLVVPLLTYDDLDAAYVTYDARDAAYATYTDQDRDYSLAGLAG